MKILKWVLIGLGIAFIAIQVVRPAKTNPEVDETRTLQAKAQITPQVAAIFERACNDCHSSKTVWPWYTQVAPISWYIIRHVNEGRKELNFSDWAKYDAKRAARKLQEICEQVEQGKMPIKNYVLLHPVASLSAEDRQAICDWAKQERERVTAGQQTAAH
jgi:hypothetical protein